MLKNKRVNALSGLYLIVTAIAAGAIGVGCAVSMPSRAYTSLLLTNKSALDALDICVNALSGLYLIVTHSQVTSFMSKYNGVNALSGLYLIVTARYYEACLAG